MTQLKIDHVERGRDGGFLGHRTLLWLGMRRPLGPVINPEPGQLGDRPLATGKTHERVQSSSPPRRRRLIERLDLCSNQREGQRLGIAGRLPPILRTRDRQNTLPFYQPPQRHLRRGLGMTFTDLTQQGHDRLRPLETITRK
jgi:hypothetical protein